MGSETTLSSYIMPKKVRFTHYVDEIGVDLDTVDFEQQMGLQRSVNAALRINAKYQLVS